MSYYGLGSRSRLGLIDRELMKDPNEPGFSIYEQGQVSSTLLGPVPEELNPA